MEADKAPDAKVVGENLATPQENIDLDARRADKKREAAMNKAARDRARKENMFDKTLSTKTRKRKRLAAQATAARARRIKEFGTPGNPAAHVSPVPIRGARIRKFSLKKNRGVYVRLPTLSVWEHAHLRIKAIYLQKALGEHGSAFSLDIHADVIARWSKPGGRGGFAYRAQQAIAAALRQVAKRLNLPTPPFWFAVDITTDNRLHIHGGIDLHPDLYKPIKAALRRVGGPWDAAAGGRQLDTQDIYEPVGWVQYCLECMERVQEVIGKTVHGCSRSLNAAARKLYDSERASLKRVKPASPRALSA